MKITEISKHRSRYEYVSQLNSPLKSIIVNLRHWIIKEFILAFIIFVINRPKHGSFLNPRRLQALKASDGRIGRRYNQLSQRTPPVLEINT